MIEAKTSFSGAFICLLINPLEHLANVDPVQGTGTEGSMNCQPCLLEACNRMGKNNVWTDDHKAGWKEESTGYERAEER